MSSLNKVMAMGYLGKDPEKRFVPSGRSVVRFSVGATRRWTSDDGVKNERTEWFQCEAWNGVGDVAAKYLRKGSQVYIEGRLQTDVVGEGENRRYYTKVVVQSLQMLDRKGETAETAEDAPEPEPDEDFPF